MCIKAKPYGRWGRVHRNRLNKH